MLVTHEEHLKIYENVLERYMVDENYEKLKENLNDYGKLYRMTYQAFYDYYINKGCDKYEAHYTATNHASGYEHNIPPTKEFLDRMREIPDLL